MRRVFLDSLGWRYSWPAWITASCMTAPKIIKLLTCADDYFLTSYCYGGLYFWPPWNIALFMPLDDCAFLTSDNRRWLYPWTAVNFWILDFCWWLIPDSYVFLYSWHLLTTIFFTTMDYCMTAVFLTAIGCCITDRCRWPVYGILMARDVIIPDGFTQ